MGVSHPGIFRTTYRFRDIGVQKSPLISRTARNFAIFRLPLQPQLVGYRLHIWQLGKSNRGVVPTVTSDDLYLLL